MMGKTALLAVGGGGLSGAAIVAALAGSSLGVVLVYLAPLPLLLVGLGLGSSAFGFAAAAGLAVALALGGFTGAGLYGGMHVIPSWLIVQQALRPSASSPDGWRPIGLIAGRADPTGCLRHGHHSLGRARRSGYRGRGPPIAGAVAGWPRRLWAKWSERHWPISWRRSSSVFRRSPGC